MVAWLAAFRAQRADVEEENDPNARSSRDVPVEQSPTFEENPLNDSDSRVRSGLPEPLPSTNSPPSESRAGEYSSIAVENDEEEPPPGRGRW